MSNTQSRSNTQMAHIQKMMDTNEPIAIVGMAALFPKAEDLQAYWRNIVNKVDCITEVPETHWSIKDYYDADPKAADKTYCKRGGFIPDIRFDPVAYGIPPNVVNATDTGQLLGLHVAHEALKDAGMGDARQELKETTSVMLGVGGGQESARSLDNRIRAPVWRQAMLEQGVAPDVADKLCKAITDKFPGWEENSFPGLLGNVVAGRIANRLNLGGTNLTVDAACASGLAAAHTAIGELRSGLSDVSITGAVDADNDVFMFLCFSKTPAFSQSNEARPFDAKGDGILIAEGIGICVIKRLSDAERDGDRIYAVIKAMGSSSDGKFKSIYAPNPDGQSKALHRAYAMAGFGPETVELVEAHGTGTKAGDYAEFTGLSRTFRQYQAQGRWCALGSVKSQIGHSKATAGIAGLIKAAMAVHQKVLPATIKVTEPNPKMEIEKTPFYLNTETRPWFRPTGSHPRRAGVSAFGFGGTNFHCVLEEYIPRDGKEPALTVPSPTSLFVFAGHGPADVLRAADAVENTLRGNPDLFRAESHRTMLAGVRGQRAILTVVAQDVADLSTKLAAARKHLQATPDTALSIPSGVFYATRADGNVQPRVAVLFPGQGSQYVNMGIQWALRYPEVRRAFEDADRLMLDAGDLPLSQVVYPIPQFNPAAQEADEKRLTETRWAQPALGALSMGLYNVFHKLGLTADCFGGHSYGELAALWAAGVLSKQEFLALSRTRGSLMAAAAAGGIKSGMSAAQGPVNKLKDVLPTLSRDVIVANINSPEQCVLAGPVDALQRLEQPLEAQGFRVKALNVSAAFHSPFVASARDPFAKALGQANFAAAQRPVYSNITAQPYPANGAGRDMLADQLVKPVNFLGLVQQMYDSGARVFLEVGAKGVLTGLVGRILADQPHTAVALDASAGRTHGDTALQLAVAQLLSRGVALDLAYLVDRDPVTQLKHTWPNTPTTITLRGANNKPHSPPPPSNPPRIGVLPAGGATSPAASTSVPVASSVVPVAAASTPPPPRPVPPPPAPRASQSSITMTPSPEPVRPVVVSSPSQTAIPTVQVIPPMSNNPGNPNNNPLLMTTQAALAAFQAQQQQLALVHQEFLRTSAEAMRSFTVMFEAHARQLAGGGVPQLAAPMTMQPPELAPLTVYPSMVAQAPTMAPPMAPPVAPPPPRPMAPAPAPVSMAPVPPPPRPPAPPAARPTPPPPAAPAPRVVAQAPVVAPPPAAPAAPAARGPAQAELSQALLSVVADKTGYPVDMLKLDMDMEADLGIDSIKRVEILGAMQAKFPNAPKLETDKLGELHTLQQILDYLAKGGVSGGAAAATAPVAAPAAPAARPAAPAPSAGGGADLGAVTQGLLAVVADKTGYPVDMLKLDMDMEADLGIDSIKRVEILGAMQAKFPNAPKLETDKLGELHTLQQIVDYLAAGMGGGGGGGAPVARASAPVAAHAPVAAAAPQVASGGPGHGEMMQGLLSVVSEKTGYPVDMLKMDMDLEADLGIDSIKRVEILGAMQARFPNAPKVETDKLGEMHTLQQIVDYLSGGRGGAAVAAPAVHAPVVSAPVAAAPAPRAPAGGGGGINMGEMTNGLLAIVSEKTGYPVDMLKMDMDLEADLGIDSIKRVEILGAMQAKFPNAPKVETDKLGEMHTLQQIVGYLSGGAAAAPAQPAAAAYTPPPQAAPPAAAAPSGGGAANGEMMTGLLAVVSEKTGYPVDMLKMDMDLEADLGIDSIKRVEILGAMQAKFPNAPKVETDKLGEMHTLQQIVDYLSRGTAGTNGTHAAPTGNGGAAAQAAGVDVRPFVQPAGAPDIRRYRVAVAPVSLPPVSQPWSPAAGHVALLTDDGQGFATALAADLKKAGWTVVLAHLPARLAPYTPDARVVSMDWTTEAGIQQGLAAVGAPVGALVHLAALRTTPSIRNLTVADLKTAITEQLKGAYLLAKHLSAPLQKSGGLFATVTSMDGSFGLAAGMVRPFAGQGGLAGLTKTLSVEWPKVACRAFDLDPSLNPQAASRELLRELGRHNGPTELGLSAHGAMRGLGMVAAEPATKGAVALDRKSVVLITGGARGVTADVALGLARTSQPTLVLLGRSAAPTGKYAWCQNVPQGELKKVLMERLRAEKGAVTPKELEGVYKEVLAEREITETLNDLRAAGSTVDYRSVDVRDEKQVADVVREVRKLGPIHGIIHGAGVIQDKLIEQKTPEMFDAVFDTKVFGLRHVLEATRGDDLRLMVFFSSIAGRSGNKGQADYAMANEVLNKMAQELRSQRTNCLISSMGWGPWQGGMVTPELERAFLAQGISAIPKDVGVRVFLNEVAGGRQDDVEIVVAGLPFPRTFEFEISAQTDRYLLDHVINGKPVLPAMAALEMFAQAVQSTIPGQVFAGVQDFRVLKGVVVDGRVRLRLTLEEAPGSSSRARWLEAKLSTVEESSVRLNYKALVRATSEPQPAVVAPRPADLLGGRYSLPVDAAYRDRLFHGPRFQVIDAIEGTTDQGMVARLRVSQPSGWSTQVPPSWVSDPAVLDGALQMVVLWIREKTGASSLPSSVGHYAQYAPFPAGEMVHIHARLTTAQAPSFKAALTITNQAGRILAEARDVELTANAALNPMFTQASGTAVHA